MNYSAKIRELQALGIDHASAERYATNALNLETFGLVVTFSVCDDTFEPDGETPLAWAQVDAPILDRLAVYQGPARDLGTFEHGLGWGVKLAERLNNC